MFYLLGRHGRTYDHSEMHAQMVRAFQKMLVHNDESDFCSSCKGCILAYLLKQAEKDEEGNCPVCRMGPVVESELLEVVRKRRQMSVGIDPDIKSNDGEEGGTDFTLRKNDFKSSTKLNALIQSLRTPSTAEFTPFLLF